MPWFPDAETAAAAIWSRLAKASSIGLEDSDLSTTEQLPRPPPGTPLVAEISLSLLKVKTSI